MIADPGPMISSTHVPTASAANSFMFDGPTAVSSATVGGVAATAVGAACGGVGEVGGGGGGTFVTGSLLSCSRAGAADDNVCTTAQAGRGPPNRETSW